MTHRQQAHPVRQFVRRLLLIFSNTGKVKHLDATQKSSDNGKGLLHLHLSTTWVGMNHTRVRRYHTFGVTQIGLQAR